MVRAHKPGSKLVVLDDHEDANGGVFENEIEAYSTKTYSVMRRLRYIFWFTARGPRRAYKAALGRCWMEFVAYMFIF